MRNVALAGFAAGIVALVASARPAMGQRYAYYCYKKQSGGKRTCFAKQCRWAHATRRAAAVREIKAACKGPHGRDTRAAVKVNSGALRRCNHDLRRRCAAPGSANNDRHRAELERKMCSSSSYGDELLGWAKTWINTGSRPAFPRPGTIRCQSGRRISVSKDGDVKMRHGGSRVVYSPRGRASRNPFMRRNARQTRLVTHKRIRCKSGGSVRVTVHLFRNRHNRIVARKWQRADGRSLTESHPRPRNRSRDRALGSFLCGKRGPLDIRKLETLTYVLSKIPRTGPLPAGIRNGGMGTRD